MPKLICVKKNEINVTPSTCMLNVRDFNQFVSIADESKYNYLDGYIVDIKASYQNCSDSVVNLMNTIFCKNLRKTIDEVKRLDYLVVDLCF
ncbi:hypothetical protein C5F64_14790 [Photobacterium damselae subsp. damselae]|nr:hypothetical protein BST98_21105 [Photobacterium damselae]PSB83335.1 hypothetical protein C5F64_14790 [Photobacterium damselae subsp. damselae]